MDIMIFMMTMMTMMTIITMMTMMTIVIMVIMVIMFIRVNRVISSHSYIGTSSFMPFGRSGLVTHADKIQQISENAKLFRKYESQCQSDLDFL